MHSSSNGPNRNSILLFLTHLPLSHSKKSSGSSGEDRTQTSFHPFRKKKIRESASVHFSLRPPPPVHALLVPIEAAAVAGRKEAKKTERGRLVLVPLPPSFFRPRPAFRTSNLFPPPPSSTPAAGWCFAAAARRRRPLSQGQREGKSARASTSST